MKVCWARTAYIDLAELVEFIEQDRPAAAAKVGRGILRTAATLVRHPERGRIAPELREHGVTEYRQILFSVYRIIYRVQPKTVDILAVIDSRRDLGQILLDRLVRRS